MARDNEDFLRRWSRRKHEAAAPAPAAAPAAPAPEPQLPSLDSLTFDSDFSAFMRSEVAESVKRAALKKLFSDPRLNVIDPLDIDIDDYSNLERIPQATAHALEHAKRALFGPPDTEKQERRTEQAEAAGETAPSAELPTEHARGEEQNGNPRQDA